MLQSPYDGGATELQTRVFSADESSRKKFENLILQLKKLNHITSLIATGKFFFYYPRSEDSDAIIDDVAHNFNSMISALREAQTSLDKKVQVRTAELESALTQIKKLKSQQDGDYYLMNLLLAPLSLNTWSGENIKVQFLIEQKVRYSYRDHQGKIGGDVCFVHRVEIGNESWCFFFNGDAMGKSLQGASGALVAGASLSAHFAKDVKYETAIDWLRDLYSTLNTIFASFQGAMFVSCVMGLIRERDGKLVYINAEHPQSVLYRRGSAAHFETEITAPKLGMLAGTTPKFISTWLRPFDCLICASDGREDLIFQTAAGNMRGQDTEDFIRIVEESKGRLTDIHDRLKKSGELMDDFSAIRITYAPIISHRTLTEYFFRKEFLTMIRHLTHIRKGFYRYYYTGYCYLKLGRLARAKPFLLAAADIRSHPKLHQLIIILRKLESQKASAHLSAVNH